jgi:hypothetical protein
MKLKTLWIMSGLLTIVCFLAQLSLACTIFYVQGQTTHYFASNEDWNMTDSVMQVIPGRDGKYGYVVFGWDSYLPRYPQGGLNEHGLALDWAALPPETFKADPSRKQLNSDLFYEILENCRNVAEAVRLMEVYNWPQFAEEHLLIADSLGNSSVIEWHDGKYLILPKEGTYQVITNFRLSAPGSGWYPCNRFETVDGYLKSDSNQKPDLTVVRNLLDQAHQEGEYPTIYSYIADLKSLDLYLYYGHDYSKEYQYNLRQELVKGAHRIKFYQ